MHIESDRLRHADRITWLLIAAVATIVVIAVAFGPFRALWASFGPVALATAVFVAGGWFYGTIRRDRRIADSLTATAQLMSFTAVAAPLSYIAATAELPLRDAMLARWDASLGFDWTAWMTFVASHPLPERILRLAYSSFAVQTIAVLLVLGFSGQSIRLRVFIAAFIATSLTTVMISAAVPATGPWLFHGVDATMTHGVMPASSSSWPVFLGLRDGTTVLLDGLNSEGIITFPSLHAGFAALFVLALWRTPRIRWFAVALNATMLLATPTNGSHYLVDVVAGLVIPVLCWAAVARLIAAGTTDVEPRRATAPSIVPDAVPAAPLPDSRQPLKAT
ncbi:MAG: phosphatase PAP2 family protein [Xanthobacteraceae bacterium]|nr:phosphatase PAP2 family protein [Xanthobacteraceae bacterium]